MLFLHQAHCRGGPRSHLDAKRQQEEQQQELERALSSGDAAWHLYPAVTLKPVLQSHPTININLVPLMLPRSLPG
jgi:hypothetical protein